MKAQELIIKYGAKIALIIVDEIIKEYDENICYCGYDNDWQKWNESKKDWVKVRDEIINF